MRAIRCCFFPSFLPKKKKKLIYHLFELVLPTQIKFNIMYVLPRISHIDKFGPTSCRIPLVSTKKVYGTCMSEKERGKERKRGNSKSIV